TVNVEQATLALPDDEVANARGPLEVGVDRGVVAVAEAVKPERDKAAEAEDVEHSEDEVDVADLVAHAAASNSRCRPQVALEPQTRARIEAHLKALAHPAV